MRPRRGRQPHAVACLQWFISRYRQLTSSFLHACEPKAASGMLLICGISQQPFPIEGQLFPSFWHVILIPAFHVPHTPHLLIWEKVIIPRPFTGNGACKNRCFSYCAAYLPDWLWSVGNSTKPETHRLLVRLYSINSGQRQLPATRFSRTSTLRPSFLPQDRWLPALFSWSPTTCWHQRRKTK